MHIHAVTLVLAGMFIPFGTSSKETVRPKVIETEEKMTIKVTIDSVRFETEDQYFLHGIQLREMVLRSTFDTEDTLFDCWDEVEQGAMQYDVDLEMHHINRPTVHNLLCVRKRIGYWWNRFRNDEFWLWLGIPRTHLILPLKTEVIWPN